jgi:hypothetical protein
MHAISVIFVTGSLKRKKSSFAIDLTDVSKKGAKRMRYEYVFILFDYLFNFLSGIQLSHNIKIAIISLSCFSVRVSCFFLWPSCCHSSSLHYNSYLISFICSVCTFILFLIYLVILLFSIILLPISSSSQQNSSNKYCWSYD